MDVSIFFKTHIPKHLKHEAKGMDYLALWLDCDREGENICFEVISCVESVLNYKAKILRAKFSAIAESDIKRAMQNFVAPNQNEARAVDARFLKTNN
jgi:DNA topoisomerase-3